MKISCIAYLISLILIAQISISDYASASRNIYYLEIESVEMGYNNYVVYGDYYISPLSFIKEKSGKKGSLAYHLTVYKDCKVLTFYGDKTYFTCNVLGENITFSTSMRIYSEYVSVLILTTRFSDSVDEDVFVIRLINNPTKLYERGFNLTLEVSKAILNDLEDRFGKKIGLQAGIGSSWFGGPTILLLNIFDDRELEEIFEIVRRYIPEEYPVIIYLSHYMELYTPPEVPKIIKGISSYPLNDVLRYLVVSVLVISLTYLYISSRRF